MLPPALCASPDLTPPRGGTSPTACELLFPLGRAPLFKKGEELLERVQQRGMRMRRDWNISPTGRG